MSGLFLHGWPSRTQRVRCQMEGTPNRSGLYSTPITIHSTLAVLNRLFHFQGRDECRVKFLKIQRQMFRDVGRDLTRAEYERLLTVAQTCGQGRLALLMETICVIGIRVSEVRYITVEAALKGRADISLKGKIRTILIPTKLAKKLLKYAKAQNRFQ